MKATVQAPYVIIAIVAWPIVGALAFHLTGNANTGLAVACIVSFIVWMIGRDKAQSNESVLEDPPARLFAVSDFDVLATIKDVMGNNVGDKWWNQRFFDDAPDEQGVMKAKYVMVYKEEFGKNPPTMLERQLILDIQVTKVASATSVKLKYQVASEKYRWTANEILEQTTGMIWSRLEKLVEAKTTKTD